MKTIEKIADKFMSEDIISYKDSEREIFIQGIRAAQKWTDVEDGLPDGGVNVLVMNEGFEVSIGYYIEHYHDWTISKFETRKKVFGEVKRWRQIILPL